MKKFIFIVLMMIGCGIVNATNAKGITYERLIASIAFVESRHNANLVSKNKTYVGYLQISKVCVNEANNIVGYKKYKYADRFDKAKSIEMFHIIQEKHNPKKDIYLAMRIWNEGTSAKYKKFRMTPYMKKVLRHYETRFAHLPV